MRKHKALIGRTGKKQKQARERAAENAARREHAYQAAAVPDMEPQVDRLSEDDEFRSYQIISRVVDAFIDDLIAQLEDDERKSKSALLLHEMHQANAIACAEAYKRRSALNPLSNERACEPFRLAWEQALCEWETAYKTDVCAACSKEWKVERHLARCSCFVDCRGCGQRVPARPWRVGMLPCRCEKISTIAGRLFGSGIDYGSDFRWV